MARPALRLGQCLPPCGPLISPLAFTRPFGHSSRLRQVDGATEISHSQFLATAKADSDFNPSQTPHAGQETASSTSKAGQSSSYGRLDPTNSHLFKLILPLPTSLSNPHKSPLRPTAFLLHPSQPLSHLSRLITGSLPPSERNAEITYLALTGKEADLETHLRNAEEEAQKAESMDDGGAQATERQEGGPYLTEREKSKGRWQEVSWSQSTDLSDFIKQSSSLNERFKIVIQPETKGDDVPPEQSLTVEVVIPSFASRTTYLRERLVRLSKELDIMTKKKKAWVLSTVHLAAHRSARRMGTTALTAGVVYWGAVIRWTFFTDAGWDLMEPVTWATGFGALLCGTGFLIYHNREVSYSSLLDLSITARQRTLYDKHGLDIERWTELVAEAKTLRREIKRVAADYDIEWKGELENLANMDRYSPSLPQSPSPSGDNTSLSTTGEKGKAAEDDNDGKIDIDKTIDEASELAERTKERTEKAKDAERKGEVVDDRTEEGKKQEKVAEDERKGEKKGKEKAKEVIKKNT